MSRSHATKSLRVSGLTPKTRSGIDWLLSLAPEQRTATIAKLTPTEQAELSRAIDDWSVWARPSQLQPSGDWRIWALITGRGWGKNRVQAEFAHSKASDLPKSVGFIAGRTLGDVMRTVVHHPRSGLLVTSKPDNPCDLALQGGSTIVKWRNGSRAEIHTSEEPDRARGPEYDWGIADEIATWKRVVDFAGNTTWTNLEFGLRGGMHPQMVAGTTPRRGAPLVKELIERASDTGTVRVTRGSLLENRANLPDSYVEEILEKHGGTHLGRQEIEGEILPDVEGAIVTIDMIEEDRIEESALPELRRIAIGIDPSGGRNEQGIIACGLGVDGHGYVLRDRSGVFSPEGWARRAIDLYGELDADAIVAERNYGGDMVESTIRSIDPRVRVVLPTASRGKHVRFEPVGSLYEQRKIHHVGMLDQLEDEVTAFTPAGYDGSGSPNRCLAAGTLVATERGEVPIERVCVGDRVWTRYGLRTVTASRLVEPAACVIRRSFSDGREIVGTPDHKVYTENRGFVPMDSLVWDDILLAWRAEKTRSGSTALSSFAIRIAATRPRVATTPLTTAVSALAGWIFYIVKSGKRPMGRSSMGARYITETKIRSTTRSIISRWSRLRNTLNYTRALLVRGSVSILSASDLWLRSGIEAVKVSLGIGSTGAIVGGIDSQLFAFAVAAESSTSPLGQRDSALSSARCDFTRVRNDSTRTESAWYAAPRSLSRVRRNSSLARVRAGGISGVADPLPVYDLTVDGAHEYFANGILVHNCDAMVWAFTELMLGEVEKRAGTFGRG